ncbi:FecR protein [Roseimaritima multifibrata]|uniref:FecR protein n=1 Tax=Roseimaritima multifibrata TaxID=1930274 RepID=A0A517MGC9_9BACT|nr:FecR domain-containing protein [Roseimaritima multifibrata]QDS93943.1 FecR protein [Roseimaritima multifibrata]
MSVQERFVELWTDYLEGDLEEAGLTALQELLAADDALVQQAADMFQTHRLLGLVTAEQFDSQEEFIRETLARLPANENDFSTQVMSKITNTVSTGTVQLPPSGRKTNTRSMVAVLLGGLALGAFAFLSVAHQSGDEGAGETIALAPSASQVRMASSSHAKFFGELAPPIGASLVPQREYVLMSGMVEVKFPAGASAIMEGPAVFHISSDESLALDVGRCSVHAPDGAEGFRVDTPNSRIVDRGTRFAVNVSESTETDVQVIEGAADIYDVDRDGHVDRRPSSETRLVIGEAKRFAKTGVDLTDSIPFDASSYRRSLPDRVVSYEATVGPDGGAENLVSVTVQRGGQMDEILVDDLIPAQVTYFHSATASAFLCGKATLPEPRVSVAADHSLVSGVINPPGSREALTESPVMEGDNKTPGMAIGFERAVVNGPGADVVLFDLQTFVNPPDGDPFHVSPLVFREGLRSHTISKYDLTMESPESLNLTDFHVHFFDETPDSLAKLNSLNTRAHQQAINFRGLAVGIDLSDLGYAEGEAVSGLFIQDALDDPHHVDPVFIGGLPEVK